MFVYYKCNKEVKKIGRNLSLYKLIYIVIEKYNKNVVIFRILKMVL